MKTIVKLIDCEKLQKGDILRGLIMEYFSDDGVVFRDSETGTTLNLPYYIVDDLLKINNVERDSTIEIKELAADATVIHRRDRGVIIAYDNYDKFKKELSAIPAGIRVTVTVKPVEDEG